MAGTAFFRFQSTLNDFLDSTSRNCIINYSFRDHPTVKDAIEALGVPHPEVNQIIVNGKTVDFAYKLLPGDEIEVYPIHEKSTIDLNANLIPEPETPHRFMLDVHLGKLGRLLRMLGFDTTYDPELTEKEVATIAARENRILLSRGVGILKLKMINYGYWLRSQQPDEQLLEVIRYYKLAPEFKLFSRCMVCNGEIREVDKEKVQDQLPPKTRLYFQQFYQCNHCLRVYWKGSHYERMQAFIRQL
ncbi:Mut7-C RNAse domain-containing protein [Pontibacter populi]|uniref:Mut7-C RNAse domain-containing protein n=1 Tax=Pontibacter populi TaxID=890055 RepID=A0ABV1RWU4_9BACT